MVQQLTREGNIRTRFLNASPMGLIASTTWSCSLTLSTKKLNRASGVPSVCLDFSRCLGGGRGEGRRGEGEEGEGEEDGVG